MAVGILVVLCCFAIVLLTAVVVSAVAGRPSEAALAWTGSALIGAAILGAVWFLALRPWGASWKALGLGAPSCSLPRCAAMTAGALFLSLGTNAAYVGLISWLGLEALEPPGLPGGLADSPPALAITVVTLALWTPFTEEVFFRGFMLAGLAHRLGAGGAMMASALIFSAFHIDPGVMGPIFVTGLLLSWLYIKSGSIWPCVAAHAGQNALAVAATALA